MSQDVFEANTKQLLISFDNGASTYELGCSRWNKRLQNEVNDFAEPSNVPQEVQRRIQNLNQIEEVHTFEALISDEFVEVSEFYTGDVTKEDVEESMDNVFKGTRLLEIEYGHVNVTGFMTEYSVEETWTGDGSIFTITFDLLVGVPMSS